MKQLLLFISFILPLFSAAQPWPSETEAVAEIELRTFDKEPIAKMEVTLHAGTRSWKGVTDKQGITDILVPVGAYLQVSIGDSANYDEFQIPNKPWQKVKHIVYYYGAVNGKMLPKPANPTYAAQRAKPGTSRMTMTFVTRDNDPVKDELVTVTGPKGDLTGVTDTAGKVTFILETGIPYKVKVKYNQNMHDLLLKPIYYGTGEASITYQYAGSKVIESEIAWIKGQQDTLMPSYIQMKTTQPAPGSPSIWGGVAVNENTYISLQSLAMKTGGKALICTVGQEVVLTVKKILTEEVKPKADVFILVDVSGSMTDNIDSLKQNLETELREIATRKGIRLGIAGFDSFITDGTNKGKFVNLSPDPAGTFTYLKNITIFGGDEMVFDACAFACTKPDWQSTTQRVVIVLGDEPPQVNPKTGIDEKDVIELAKGKGVNMNLYPVLIGGY